MSSRYYLELVRAEYIFVIAEIFRRKSMLFTVLIWPYILLTFILLLGSAMGGLKYFQARVGVNPVIFFITGGFLLITSLAFFDDVASRFWYDEFIGVLPYIIMSPISKVLLAFAMAIPRLTINILLGVSSLIPVYVVFKGVQGITDSLIVIALSILGALLFSTLAMVFAIIVLVSGGGWRVMNIIRPLIMLLSGVMYPRFILPYVVRLISSFIPLAHTAEIIQVYIVHSEITSSMLTLLGIAIALFIIYMPVSIRGFSYWELKVLRKGVKT